MRLGQGTRRENAPAINTGRGRGGTRPSPVRWEKDPAAPADLVGGAHLGMPGRVVTRLGEGHQTGSVSIPDSARWLCSSPLTYISFMMSQPPTNSPLT